METTITMTKAAPRAKCTSLFYIGVVVYFLAIGLVALNAYSTGYYNHSGVMDNTPPYYSGYSIRTMNFSSTQAPENTEQVILRDMGSSLSKDKPYLYQLVVEVQGGRILSNNFYFVKKLKDGN